MAYSATYDYRYGFILDEDQLISLGNRLKDTLDEFDSSTPLNYEICWEEPPYSYATEDISSAINATHGRKKIEHITISPTTPHWLNFKVDFSEGGIVLEVSGGDGHPQAERFAKDIAGYFVKDIKKNRLTWSQIRRTSFVLLFGVSLCWLWYLPVIQSKGNTRMVDEVLRSQDVNLKLDYLVGQLTAANPGKFLVSIIILNAFLLLVWAFDRQLRDLCSYFLPENVFLFGKEKKKREDYRRIFIWFAGLLTSVMGGLIVWLLTRP